MRIYNSNSGLVLCYQIVNEDGTIDFVTLYPGQDKELDSSNVQTIDVDRVIPIIGDNCPFCSGRGTVNVWCEDENQCEPDECNECNGTGVYKKREA